MQLTLSCCECNGLWQWTRRYQIPPNVRCEAWFGFCKRKTLDPVKFTKDLLQSMANMLWTRPVSENGAQCLGMGEQMFMTLRGQGDLLSSQTHLIKRWIASFERIDISQLVKWTMSGSVSYSCVRNCHRTFAIQQNSQANFWYEEGISKLVSRYDKCLSVQGDYVEK